MADPRTSRLPSGTVTLLFTDIEGSTRALRALGPLYRASLARHRELVRTAAGRFGGVEVDTQGDAFLLAFPAAGDAVAAAVEAQRALGAEPWAEGTPIRVRMGLHTGRPDLDDEGYVGIDLHLAARICGAAHGGQVLLSSATKELAGDAASIGVDFRDLGSHRLKDFEETQRLFQADADGLDGVYPPLRTATAIGLPLPSYRLVGREPELALARSLLARSDVRLVTLTGPGGTGKSRLALELAWESLGDVADGVALVRLAPVADPELVPSVIAAALGIRDPGERPLLDAIAEQLGTREVLVVLDNVEHLLDAVAPLGRLLADCPGLLLLATSRSRLGLSGEHVLALEPLPEDDAAVLFGERALAADSRFDAAAHEQAVREICRRLDGLPLAIELAAARVALLPPAAILARLDLALLAGGPADRPERQRTIRGTIGWSYDLLTSSQRRLHTGLSVFAGGWSLAAVEATCDEPATMLDDLSTLVAGSLVHRVDASDEPRFRMLEVVRQFAREELALEGREQELRDRHAAWVAAFAADTEAGLAGPEQAAWLERAELELPNVRAALDWSLTGGSPSTALRIASALHRFWRAHGYVAEARNWLGEGLARAADADPSLRADALWAAGRQAMAQGDGAAAEPLLEDALELFRSLGRTREVVFALSELGLAAWAQGDLDRAEARCEEALAAARATDDPRALSAALSQLAGVVGERGDHAHARSLHEEALALRRGLGDPLLVANAANNLGVTALAQGDLAAARSALAESLELARGIGDRIHIAAALCGLGQVALLADDPAGATRQLSESLELYLALADARSCAECVSGLAAVAAAEGRPGEAARLWGRADELRGAPATGVAESIESRFRAATVRLLGEEEFDAAVRAGVSRPLEELLGAPAAPLPAGIRPQ